MTISTLTVQSHSPEEAQAIADELIAVYAEVYNVEPYAGDPFFSVPSYINRLHAAFEMPGFGVVTARLGDGSIAGYVHGVNLDPERAWWASLGDKRPAEVVEAAERGEVFWLRELMTLPAHQNRGIGRRLHDVMVLSRPEPWTTLTCIIDNEPARSAYPRWGYEVIGRIKHAPESPVYDAMILHPQPAAQAL
ncbi:GNAT family N-acetyltransferase [Streptomyces sp. CSDS2]|uniref:GNAT family N-acetyltransferase n=1 Tax=Streptomyces sp. CSDS2 TaxID=3055051 RepID=UPI0025B091DF|nr:GNAT family N-acetyltransferase [Streptomyces sp. CSDS2]MDN3265677.1 GNAT family N-acetyltransferase [Streptomyces sp. CSDS2]